jgi:hypothetical protein
LENQENPKSIDISELDLEQLKLKVAENPGLLPYAHHVGSPAIKPEDPGRAKGKSLLAMYQQTDNQLAQVYKQVELMLAQAQAIQNRRIISERIYAAQMPSEPVIGQTYYLYRRDERTDVVSLVAPNEWGRSFKFQAFIASIQLMADRTWQVVEEGEEIEHWKSKFML